MARVIFVLALCWCCWATGVFGCDACGCNVGGSNIGLLTGFRNNTIGLSWQQASFAASPEHGTGTADQFNTFELSFRYQLGARFKILAYQPYRLNIRNSPEGNGRLSGLSDTRIAGSYVLWNQAPVGTSKLYLEAGAGVKLPVGKYDAHLHDKTLPENFNLGNGSWGYLAQANAVLSWAKSGIFAGGTYQFNQATHNGYHFGNQFNAQALYFLQQPVKNIGQIIPFGGIQFENISHDKYANGKNVPGTGGTGALATIGFQFKIDYFLAGVSYAYPVYQTYSNSEVDAKGRTSIQLSYIF